MSIQRGEDCSNPNDLLGPLSPRSPPDPDQLARRTLRETQDLRSTKMIPKKALRRNRPIPGYTGHFQSDYVGPVQDTSAELQQLRQDLSVNSQSSVRSGYDFSYYAPHFGSSSSQAALRDAAYRPTMFTCTETFSRRRESDFIKSGVAYMTRPGRRGKVEKKGEAVGGNARFISHPKWR